MKLKVTEIALKRPQSSIETQVTNRRVKLIVFIVSISRAVICICSHTNCYIYVVTQCHIKFMGPVELGIFVPLPDESLLDSHKGHNRYSLPQPKR